MNTAAVETRSRGQRSVLEFIGGTPGVNFAAHYDRFVSTHYDTIVCQAAGSGRVDVLEFLEGKPGVDFSAKYNGAVRSAAIQGHLDVLKFLDGKPGVDFSTANNFAVYEAAAGGRADILEFLEGKPGVDFSAEHNSAACLAARYGHIDVLEFLDGKPGVDFSAVNNYAAARAAEYSQVQALKFLGTRPGVRMAQFLHRVATGDSAEWQAERQAWEDKQNAFVASSEALTKDDVKRAVRNKLIFRELEGLALNGAVRKCVETQIAKEYAEDTWRKAWRKGNGRQLLSQWSIARVKRRHERRRRWLRAGAGSVVGSSLLRALEGLPRPAMLELLQQTTGAKIG